MSLYDLEIRIDRLVLELDSEPGGSAERRALVEAALKRLGERLAGSPLARRHPASVSLGGAEAVSGAALERLSVDTLAVGELLGPRGAERLADELYAALARRLG
jgi:hypothetical protein